MPVYNRRRGGGTTRRAQLFDRGTGLPVAHVFFWDSDTGQVGRYLPDGGGRLQRDATGLRLAEVWETRALRIEWAPEPTDDGADIPHVVPAG